MNPIVAATDFSAAGNNAAHYAASLAQYIGTGLVLLNVYRLPVPMNDMPALFLPLEEIQKTSEDQLQNYRSEILSSYPGLDIKVEAVPGTVSAVGIVEYAEEYDPFILVVGTHGLNGVENWLGSTTLTVIKEASFPVIAVPVSYNKNHFENITWASDLKPLNASSVAILKDVVSTLKARLTIIHVTEHAGTSSADYHIKELSELSPSFEAIENNDVTEGVQQYLANSNTDLLMVVPHHYNLFESLFEKKHVRALVSEMPIPVLCIPENR